MSFYPTCVICEQEIDLGAEQLRYCKSCGSEFHTSCLPAPRDRCTECATSFYEVFDEEEEETEEVDLSRRSIFEIIPKPVVLIYFMAAAVLALIGIIPEYRVWLFVGLGLIILPFTLLFSYLLLEQRVINLLKTIT